MIVEYKFKVTGVVPLIMHNGQTADPMNEWSKRIKKVTSKRQKTESDYEELVKLEWFAGLYLNDEGKPCIPGEVVEGAFFEAAKKTKQGKLSKSCIFSEGNFTIEESENTTLDDLFLLPVSRLTCSVVVNGKRVVRTRPKFEAWSAVVSVWSDDSVLNDEEVVRIMKTAGLSCGFCDWRPRFGRFGVELLSTEKKEAA